MLAEAHRAGSLALANADLKDNSNIKDLQDSAVVYKNAVFHFIIRFVEPQHVWDLGIGAVRHERITIGAGDGREGNRSTDRGCGQPRCDVVQFDPHGGTPSWKLNPDSL